MSSGNFWTTGISLRPDLKELSPSRKLLCLTGRRDQSFPHTQKKNLKVPIDFTQHLRKLVLFSVYPMTRHTPARAAGGKTPKRHQYATGELSQFALFCTSAPTSCHSRNSVSKIDMKSMWNWKPKSLVSSDSFGLFYPLNKKSFEVASSTESKGHAWSDLVPESTRQ